jgi:hypothetical protein
MPEVIGDAKMKDRKSKASFAQRVVHLISEPDFARFENMLGEPNIFKIVGRAHYERWHSCFLGWLLDAGGSHLLGDYVLRRFLLLLLDDRCLRAKGHASAELLHTLPLTAFSNVEVTPNEFVSNERSIDGVGRFDVFLTADYADDSCHAGKLNVIFELKIDSKPDSEQSGRYADWLCSTHANDTNFLIYLTPKLGATSLETSGDSRWYCLDYQLLNDSLLTPLLDHPNLNDKVKPFIVQYVKNLKFRYKGVKMAITNEEKRMALALYDKYGDVFDAIYDALVAEGKMESAPSEAAHEGRASGRLAVSIDGQVFANGNVRQLFEAVLRYLVDKQYVMRLPLPWGTSVTRYIIANAANAVHPNGREFFYPVRYKDYALESHYSRERGLKVLGDLCRKLELDFEVIET